MRFSFEKVGLAKFLGWVMGLCVYEARFVVDHCSNLELVEWTWGSSVIVLKLEGVDEALVEEMDLELWPQIWWFWQRLYASESIA